MSNFYTSVLTYGNRILYRGIENGRRIKRKVEYQPTLFVPSQKQTEYTTIHSEYVAPVCPGDLRDCRDFIERYKDVDGFKIYGMTRFEYQYIADQHLDHVDWKLDDIHIANLDIEVGKNAFGEYATVDNADGEITMIGFYSSLLKKYLQFGCKSFDNQRSDVVYHKCRDEVDLIKCFLEVWASDYPDLITGWNTEGFDIPYLVNRIIKILGEDFAKKLSPWNVVNVRKSKDQFGQERTSAVILGIASIDYLLLYKKFAPEGKSQDSYKLDNIGHVELGERKIAYEEYGDLDNLYTENYDLFCKYNIRDIELVKKIDDKLRLIELVLTIAYDAKCNIEDVFQQTRMWDCLTYNHLRSKNIVIPPMHNNTKDEQYEGAYVKVPQVGRHRNVASFDLTSEYPMATWGMNISPETIVEPCDYSDVHREILAMGINVESMLYTKPVLDKLRDINCSLTPNGQFFRRDKMGFMPEMIEKMFADRKAYKNKMLEAQKELEEIERELERRGLV